MLRQHFFWSDVIMATGRSDYPNQVNNVLGFPYIFRGEALDVRAGTINEAMKLAAVKALARLATKNRCRTRSKYAAYNNTATLKYGPDYIIPKPLDPRLLVRVSSAVARAAVESGVAKKVITDWDTYENQLLNRLGSDDNLLRYIINKAKQDPKRVVLLPKRKISKFSKPHKSPAMTALPFRYCWATKKRYAL